MKLVVKQPVQNENNVQLQEIDASTILVNNYAILSIDGSTSNSGLAIMRESDGALMYTMSASREENIKETPVHYKIMLKRAVTEILRNNKFIKEIYYEEPVVHNMSAVKNLFMLRSFIEELVIENEPEFDYLKYYEVPNMRWKKEFLAPDKVPTGTDNQKAAVRKRLLLSLPMMENASQDEIDAIAMGFVACTYINNGKSGEELKSKKKTRPFKFESEFIGADSDDEMLGNLTYIYKGPEKILDNGILIAELDKKTNFNQFVYDTMGDEDRLIIIKFSSKHHGNIILEYKVGNLAEQFNYIYVLAWRKSRKY